MKYKPGMRLRAIRPSRYRHIELFEKDNELWFRVLEHDHYTGLERELGDTEQLDEAYKLDESYLIQSILERYEEGNR